MLQQINAINHALIISDDEQEILELIAKTDALYKEVEGSAQTIYQAFSIINNLCIFNLTFFLQNLITLLFTKIMNRFYQFPTFIQFADLVLFVSSLITI